MKYKILPLIAFLHLLFFHSYSQKVEREMVILEIVTATWCTYCPGAALAADDFIHNGQNVAVIEYHNNDNYSNPFSEERAVFYNNITGIPRGMFDGIASHGGGHANQSIYNIYLPLYNSRREIPSSYTILPQVKSIDGLKYKIDVICTKVADCDAKNLKLMAAVTESHIPHNWLGGLTELNFVERTMIPNAKGTAVKFSSSNQQIITLEFELKPEWNKDECELVLFLQDVTANKGEPKEIHQGTKLHFSNIMPAVHYDVALTSITDVPLTNCSGKISPTVMIQNRGLEIAKTISLNYTINNKPYTYTWEGNLTPGSVINVTLPESVFDILPENTLMISVDKINNHDDENSNNNIISHSFKQSTEVIGELKLTLRTDDKPEETSWEIVNKSGQVIVNGGPYDNPSAFVEFNRTLTMPANDCYSFILHDSGGNGLNENFGPIVELSSNGTLLLEFNGGDFGSKMEMTFSSSETSINTPSSIDQISVYPNPTQHNFTVEVTLSQSSPIDITVFDACGRVVSHNSFSHRIADLHLFDFSAEEYESGIYFISIATHNQTTTKRLVIQ